MAATTAEAPTEASLHEHWKPRVNPWLIAMTVALAAFMEVLDTSIANVALPHIAGNLGASTDQGTWVLTSYLVANAIVLPLGGWASSVFGRKNFFLLCITIFTVASFLCGIAPTLPILLLCRVLQGAGGGGLQPMAQAIMADSFDERQRGLAFALYGLVAVLAPSIGPTLGGWITDSYSWRWIFYINIPVGMLTFLLVTRLVDDPPWIKADRKNLLNIDYVGLGFLTLAMGGLQIMLDKGEENDWFASNFIRIFAVFFVVGIIGLIVWEWRQKKPLINLRLFRYKNFAVCCFLMMLVGGVLNASTVLQPLFLQQLLGYTATKAGEALTAGGIALVIVMPMAGYMTNKFSARNLAAAGFSIFAFSYYFSATHIDLQMSFSYASWLRILQVFPIPFAFISITNAAYVGMPRSESNQVAGLINFVRNIGGSIFIAVTNAVVTNRTLWHEARLQNHMQDGNIFFHQQVQALSSFFSGHAGAANGSSMALSSIYNQLNQQAAMQGYQDVYMLLCWMSLAMIATAFLLSKNRPGQGGGSVAMH
ncbi:DHA2 family efflux MFS transporter permease subunit [Paracidobacterium acidisoli]|uniref:DHA2 family efflux MFS transporter permease subunit n=1 Tax=Paracidobacterium acidisoli TaxID=2303751 RepID=A0A372IPG5_9BACT|nr:DHA2 family efflux MFS transporter permease subunit [Paracidobacterium acidisoli]